MAQPRIVFQDTDLLIIDKPAGWIANCSRTTASQPTLQAWLENNFPSQLQLDRAGLVHRLDKETSGLLLVAKKATAFANLQAQFKNRLVCKKYLVLLNHRVMPVKGCIQTPIIRNPFNRHRFGVFLGGRPARTAYQVITVFASPRLGVFSLVEAEPRTGRTHQIRVHFKHSGFPVVGDILYAGRKTARSDRRWCPRHFLHAACLEFKHPASGKCLVFHSPLPGDLQRALDFIQSEHV